MERSENITAQDGRYKENIKRLHTNYCKEYTYQDTNINRICRSMLDFVQQS